MKFQQIERSSCIWKPSISRRHSLCLLDALNGFSALNGTAPAPATGTILPVTSQQKVGAPIEAGGKNVAACLI
jgi:hypothetical protein